MRKSNSYERLWVSGDFKRLVKSEAALKGKDIVSYTKDLTREFMERKNTSKDNKKRERFDFGF